MSLNDIDPYEWDQAARKRREAREADLPDIEFTPVDGVIPEPVLHAGRDLYTRDVVKNPEHYEGEIECIDAIRASMSTEEYRGYLKGNVLKYVWRYRRKNGLEDLRKSKVYQEWLIQSVAELP